MMTIHIGSTAIRMLDVDDRTVMHERQGGYERASLAAWAKMVKPGAVAIDVGAYTGVYSIVAAKCGATVFAFEPMPANYWRLGVNIALNKVNVETIAAAVSDHDGTAMLHFNPKVPLTTGASLERGVKAHAQSIKVACTTLDCFVFEKVAAIKIDVERHECAVLQGAKLLIARDRPMLLIETLDDAMRQEVMRLLPHYKVDAVLDERNTIFAPQ